jgi:hypothetical protein
MNVYKVIPIEKYEQIMRNQHGGGVSDKVYNDSEVQVDKISSVLLLINENQREDAKQILEYLVAEPDPLNWNSQGQIEYKNIFEHFSRIDQLIDIATTKKKFRNWDMPGMCLFLSALQDKQVPVQLLSTHVKALIDRKACGEVTITK